MAGYKFRTGWFVQPSGETEDGEKILENWHDEKARHRRVRGLLFGLMYGFFFIASVLFERAGVISVGNWTAYAYIIVSIALVGFGMFYVMGISPIPPKRRY